MTFGDGLATGIITGIIATLLCGAVGAWLMAIDQAKIDRNRRAENRIPVCGCRHHLSFHDDDGCHHKEVGYNGVIECGCTRYVGPREVEA